MTRYPYLESGELTVGSLFSGIGGLDLGLERAGMTVRWQSELDPYCSRVLAKHWPDVPNLGDVTSIDWETVERVDLICGGYPCQPFSLAGARRGHDDARHLWPYFADALRVLRPRFALLENVPGHLSLGFGDVLGDLVELGYDAEWESIPAAAVGAPHLRYRIFVVAYAHGEGEPGQPLDAVTRSGELVPNASGEQLRQQSVAFTGRGGTPIARDDGAHRVLADTASDARRVCDGNGAAHVADADEERRGGRSGIFGPRGRGQLADGRQWLAEPDVGRVAHGVPSRVDRLRALGNAVVPQVAEFVGRQLLESLERAA